MKGNGEYKIWGSDTHTLQTKLSNVLLNVTSPFTLVGHDTIEGVLVEGRLYLFEDGDEEVKVVNARAAAKDGHGRILVQTRK